MKEVDFYEIVTVVDTEDTRRWKIANKEGIIVGKARQDEREDGEVVSYSILLDDYSYSVTPGEIVPTGRRVRREDVYPGESIRVSAKGEYLGPGNSSTDPGDK